MGRRDLIKTGTYLKGSVVVKGVSSGMFWRGPNDVWGGPNGVWEGPNCPKKSILSMQNHSPS